MVNSKKRTGKLIIAQKPVPKKEKPCINLERIVLFPGDLEQLNQFKDKYFDISQNLIVSISFPDEVCFYNLEWAEKKFKRSLIKMGYDGVINYAFGTLLTSDFLILPTMSGYPIKRKPTLLSHDFEEKKPSPNY
jgi:hypothetical protein